MAEHSRSREMSVESILKHEESLRNALEAEIAEVKRERDEARADAERLAGALDNVDTLIETVEDRPVGEPSTNLQRAMYLIHDALASHDATLAGRERGRGAAGQQG